MWQSQETVTAITDVVQNHDVVKQQIFVEFGSLGHCCYVCHWHWTKRRYSECSLQGGQGEVRGSWHSRNSIFLLLDYGLWSQMWGTSTPGSVGLPMWRRWTPSRRWERARCLWLATESQSGETTSSWQPSHTGTEESKSSFNTILTFLLILCLF